MPFIKVSAARAFVKNAPLPAPPARVRGRAAPLLELKDTDAQALVVGSGLVVAAQDVPAQTRADLINCTLFAQLAASGSIADSSDVTAWYAEYFKALTALGWSQHDTEFKQYKASGASLEAHKSIIKVLGLLLGPQVAAVTLVTQTLEALQSMNENSPWITLFDQQSATTRTARFQVATAQYVDTDELEVALIAFDLKSKQKLTQVLFFKFNKSAVAMKYASGRASIFEAALAQSREEVAARLAAYRTEYVKEVKFPPLGASPSVHARSGRLQALRRA